MTIEQTRREMERRLSQIYDRRESQWIARLVMEHLTRRSEVDLLIRADEEVSDFTVSKIEEAMTRLLRHEPVQYVLGEAYFCGYRLKVDPSTLIPRPETAELVNLIIDDAAQRPDLRVLDVGTGSGCIAIALAMGLRFPEVTAIDISENAVAVARENAVANRAKVDVMVGDAFTWHPSGNLDIVVSNPPYILGSERKDMEPNVLDYEPSTALFVDDDARPLRIYEAITRMAADSLVKGGRLYFEINPLEADAMRGMVEAYAFHDVTLHRDSQGRYRFLSATL